MKNSNLKSKKKLYEYLIILGITILTCGIFLRFHKITDIYWDIQMGYREFSLIAFKDGRIINYLFLNIANIFKIKMPIYLFISNLSSIFIYTTTIYIIYNYILELNNNSNILYKTVILIGSILIVLNPMTIEHFAYAENIVMSVSMLFCAISAIIISKREKYFLIKAICLMLLTAILYQGTANLFLTLSVIFLIMSNVPYKKYIKRILEICIVAIITVVFMVVVIKIANEIMKTQQSRIEFSIERIGIAFDSLKYLFKVCTISLNYNYFPNYIIIISILATILILSYQKKPIEKMIKYVLIILTAMLSCIIPVILQKSITISARMSCSIGAIIGISIVYLGISVDEKRKLLLKTIVAISITLLIMNIINYQRIAILNYITNEAEKKHAGQIIDLITEYEAKNNVLISNISFCRDFNSKSTYYNFGSNTFTESSIYCTYSQLGCIEYYSNRKFNKVDMNKEIFYQYFYKNDWNDFSNEQVKFDGNTVYICLY